MSKIRTNEDGFFKPYALTIHFKDLNYKWHLVVINHRTYEDLLRTFDIKYDFFDRQFRKGNIVDFQVEL